MTTIARPTSTTRPTTTGRRARIATRAGWILTAALTLFFVFDFATKLLQVQAVVDATVQMGFPAGAVPVIGATLLVCTVLWVIPRTTIIGAVALTGYLGGAVCSQLRLDADLFSTMLFPVYVGLLVWTATLLRSAATRALVKAGH
jgi:DoxX-like family